MKKILLTSIIAAFFWPATAQQESPKKDTWQLSVSGGASIPVGTFARHDAAEAMIYNTDNPNRVLPPIRGISKSKDGFARQGYYYNADLSLITRPGITFSLRGGRSVNSHRTQGIENFMSDYYNNTTDTQFFADDYQVNYLLSGMGYSHSIGAWQVKALMAGGIAMSKYPFYKRIYYTLESVWRPEKPWPNLYAFAFGYSINLARNFGKHFTMQADFSYVQASFRYYMANRISPGGSTSYFDDTLNWKVLQTGLSIGFRW